MLNTNEIIAKHFEGDPANAVRAHAAVQEILRAQADARPVAWCRRDTVMDWQGQLVNAAYMFPSPEGLKDPIPLYTHPEASSPGLSDEDRSLIQEASTHIAVMSPWGHKSKYVIGLRAILTRASAATVAEPSDKLNAPAQVGNTVFGKGVEKRLVIEAAQRNYQRTHNQTEEDKRIAAGVESLTQLRKQIEAENDAKSPFQREVEKMGKQAAQQQADLGPFKRYTAFEQAGKEASERTAKLHEYLAKTSGEKSAQQQAEPGADERAASEAYDKVDRFLRNNLDDVDYAEYSEALECVRVAQSGQRGTPEQILTERRLTCEAIEGAISFGYQNTNPPPSDDHWLAPFWKIGRKQAELEQSGQRAGVADVAVGEAWYARLPHASALIHCWVRDVTAETVLLRENDYTNGVRYLRSDVTFIERIAAAPAQQQEGE